MFRNTYKTKITLLFLIISINLFSQTKKEIISDLNLNVGITCFRNFFRDIPYNDNMAFVSKAGTLGLEFYNDDIKTSVEVKKTFWLGVSGSSFYNDVNAWASYTYLGLTHYFKINEKRKISLNLSHCWVAENSELESYNVTTNIGKKYTFWTFYTSQAISIAPSINLTKKLFVEARFNYYYYTRADSIPKGINSNRMQFSLIYKINPLKK